MIVFIAWSLIIVWFLFVIIVGYVDVYSWVTIKRIKKEDLFSNDSLVGDIQYPRGFRKRVQWLKENQANIKGIGFFSTQKILKAFFLLKILVVIMLLLLLIAQLMKFTGNI